ncbi:hypothetical protein KA977_08425, partial [Candidatus Dependentiae bacterium]|nr:hypothetical protein [Candidatus Dependentiae bacterium]
LNLALNKSITAMSQNRSYPVKNIVDGDTNTYWLTDEGGKPNFTINFGVNTEMTTLKIKWHSRRLREGKVIIQFNNTTGERISFGYKPSANEEIIYIYKYYNTNNSYEWKNYFGYYESTGSIKASSINFQAEADGNFSKTGIYEFAVHNENAILAVKAKEAAEAQRVENAISMVINNIQILPEAEKFKLSDLQNKINYKYDPSSSSSILMKESVSKIRQNINELINKKIAESRITNLTKFVNIETKIKEWSSLLTAANDAIKAFPEVKNASTADKEKLDKARAMIESVKNAGIEESQILNHEKFAAFDVKYAEQMSGTISNGRRLNKNDKVVSQNGTYLIFKDGNLFLFDKSCKELWHANNLKSNECAYAELIDGSFQIFTWNGTMRWTSNTDGKGDYITVTDKGVEIYDKSKKPVCDIVTSQNNNLNYQTYNYEKEWADLKTRLEPGKMLEKGDKIYCYGDKKVYLEFIPASSNKTTGIGSLSIYITDDAGKFPQVHKQLMSAENAESCYMDSLGNLRVMSNTGNELWTSQTGGDDKNKNAYAIVAKSGNEYVLKIMTAEGIEAATDNQLADEAWKTQFKQGQKHYIYEKMTFAKGEYMSRKDRIISSSFVYTFGLNDKCELELVRKDTKTNSEELLFTTKDKGVGSKCVFQEDGNLVLLDKNNSKVWESGIKNQSKNKMLILTGDGDLIIDSVLDSVNSPLASVFKISVLEAEKKLEEQAAAEAKEKDEAERRYIFKRGRIMKAGGEKIAQMTYPTYVDAIKTGIAKPFIDFNVTAYIPADTNVFRISMKKIMTAKEEGFDETYDLFYGCNSVVFEEDGLLKFIDKNGKIIQSYNNATAMRFDGSYNFVINTNDGIVNLLERKSAVSKAAFEEYFVSKYDKNRNIMWFEAGDEIILDNGKQFVELDWTGKPGVLRSKTDAEKNRIIFLDNGILARYISNMDNTASVKEKLKWSDHENRIIWSSHDAALFSKINPNKVRYAIINDLQYNDIPEFAPTGNNSIAAKGFDAKSMDNWVEAISLANDMFNAMQGDYLASISIIFKMNQAQKDSNAEADKYSKLNLLAQCPKYISIKEVKLPQEKMKGHKLTLTADGKLVLYNKSGEIIWSFDTKLNPFPSDRFLYIDPKDGIVKIGKKNAIVEGNTHFINEL